MNSFPVLPHPSFFFFSRPVAVAVRSGDGHE